MPSTATPIYLETTRETIFAILDAPPQGSPLGSAVLVCPPWGWDQVASYRSRKRWAERLAAAGHPTLRFDRPANGNSAGAPEDEDLVESWLAAIAGAAGWLRETTGAPRVAALGLGLGGLVAREAIARGAPIEELVLWAAPPTGKAFVRETRAFSRLQAWHGDSGDQDGEAELSDGALEAGGFVLGADTIAALRALPLEGSTLVPLRRALLLDRDGVAVDTVVREDLEAAGAEVTTAPGAGWGVMVSHPERSRLPKAAADLVEDWLAAGEGPGTAAPFTANPPPARAEDSLELWVGDARVREKPWSLQQPFGRLFGISAEPAAEPVPDFCAVFLNAGAVRHIGPNRMWVEMARRWAARGVRSLRVDLEGIGEADGDETRYIDVSEFYVPEFDGQVEAIFDSLQEQGIARHFLLVGLCAGGYWSFRAAQRDPRVCGALLLNAGALVWHPDLLTDRDARKLGRVIQTRWWKKLLRGEIRLAQLGATARAIASKAARWLRGLLSHANGRDADAGRARLADELDRLPDGVRLTMAFSADEALEAALRAEGVPADLERWPQVSLERLPGSDHTLRPIAAQHAAQELMDRELEQVLDGDAAAQITRQR
jgi:alpha-beta hydrolase superfamily lysophospholipase